MKYFLLFLVFLFPMSVFAIGPDEFIVYGFNGKGEEIVLYPHGETYSSANDGTNKSKSEFRLSKSASDFKNSDGGKCSIEFGDAISLSCNEGDGFLAGASYRGHEVKFNPKTGNSELGGLPKIKALYEKYLSKFHCCGIAEYYELNGVGKAQLPKILIRVWHGD